MTRATNDGYGWEGGAALEDNLRAYPIVNHVWSRFGEWSTPLNAYEPYDQRYELVRGFIRAYEARHKIDPGCRAYAEGKRNYSQFGYILVSARWGDVIQKWTGDTFYLTDPLLGRPELTYVACWRFTGHPVPALDGGIDPYLLLHPVVTLTGPYGLLSPRKMHHLSVEWESR